MASLKCSKCGYGIHYHDEPNGTQLVIFEKKEWNRLIKSNILLVLYNNDDGTEDNYIIWKCFKCGTLHLYERNSVVRIHEIYEPLSNIPNNIEISNAIEGVLFDDITWEYIIEMEPGISLDWEDTKKKCEELDYKIECKYVRFNDEYILVYSDEDYKNLVSVYKRLEEGLE